MFKYYISTFGVRVGGPSQNADTADALEGGGGPGRYFPGGSGGIPPRNCLNLTGNIDQNLDK